MVCFCRRRSARSRRSRRSQEECRVATVPTHPAEGTHYSLLMVTSFFFAYFNAWSFFLYTGVAMERWRAAAPKDDSLTKEDPPPSYSELFPNYAPVPQRSTDSNWIIRAHTRAHNSCMDKRERSSDLASRDDPTTGGGEKIRANWFDEIFLTNDSFFFPPPPTPFPNSLVRFFLKVFFHNKCKEFNYVYYAFSASSRWAQGPSAAVVTRAPITCQKKPILSRSWADPET